MLKITYYNAGKKSVNGTGKGNINKNEQNIMTELLHKPYFLYPPVLLNVV